MKDYTIFVLGPSGSGKTTFLTSFFQKLASTEGTNFFLNAEDSQKQERLGNLYTQLANRGEWPDGTRSLSCWKFNCCVQNSNQPETTACGLTLFDYEGGIVTDPESGNETDLTQTFKQADAVLAILDGQKVLAFMQSHDLRDEKVNHWIYTELSSVLQIIQDANQGKFLLHFLVSKWDVLEAANYSLEDIKQKLFAKVPELTQLVNQRCRANKPVYVIPVSAVGSGFASLTNGVMKKNPEAPLLPSRVEVPLALTLSELHQNVVNPPPVKAPAKKRTGSWFKRLIYFLGGLALIAFLGSLGLLIIGVYILFRLLGFPKNNSSSNSNSIQVASSEAAFDQLLGECRQIRDRFLCQFPEAICTEIKQGVKA